MILMVLPGEAEQTHFFLPKTTKFDKKSRLERPFLAINRFSMYFWGPLGSPGASWDVPGTSRERPENLDKHSARERFYQMLHDLSSLPELAAR